MSRLLDPKRFMAEKLEWQHQVLCDPDLSAFGKTLGAFLMHYLDEAQGGGWTSQPFLAERLQVDVRTIRRAVAELETRGHLRVESSRGRGKANIYRALLKAEASRHDENHRRASSSAIPQIAPESRTEMSAQTLKTRTDLSSITAESRTFDAGKADSHALPTLIEPFTPLPPKPGGPRPAARLGGQPQRTASPAVRSLGMVEFPDVAVRSAVIKCMGLDGARSYLDPNDWRASDQTIVCRLKFSAEILRQRAGLELARLGVQITHDGALNAPSQIAA